MEEKEGSGLEVVGLSYEESLNNISAIWIHDDDGAEYKQGETVDSTLDGANKDNGPDSQLQDDQDVKPFLPKKRSIDKSEDGMRSLSSQTSSLVSSNKTLSL